MPVQHKMFRRYTLQEYIALLETFVGKVVFTQVHVHGTWKPTIADYRAAADKERLIQSMWRFHVGTRKFNDIAQHATIDPDGYIWEGRSLLQPPASSTGFNDADQDGRHPFMFEMIGNFDIGAETLKSPQLDTAVGLTRAILERWKLPAAAIKFHREMQPDKTCPGSAIDKSWFVGLVTKKEQPGLRPEDADRIIRTWLQPAWNAAGSRNEKDEIHRLANELRKASGQRIS
ncbi:peptidoglycan recognition protein family protein [Paenibacillus oenotherae]|uniref:Peptidoglycan recognition protein family protein n=1 Tax=Paenibacillus oenotherae TaxID=1435645 RepID=A0ABS7D5B3_9BACL|nr:peptidoglycan recognition family protein [Paenibacillus oenotherae]MBW7474368.1 peptidoglycan recognition protein family protein [Paenibacillus oenotherae]